jgi:hypothetical protein
MLGLFAKIIEPLPIYHFGGNMLGDQKRKLEQAIIVARTSNHLHSGGGTGRNEAHKQEHGRQGKETLFLTG